MNLLAPLALALSLTACGGADASPRVASLQDTLVVSADPELRAVAGAMLPDLAERSGLKLREPVRLERRSREALEGFLRAKLDEDLPPARAESLARAYHLLGMAPADLDLRELLLSVYLEQVAGFYDPDSTALFVLDDQPAAALQPLLLHELVHAVQDQWVDLDALTDPDVGNDRSMAAQAAIEGHATLVMLEYMTEQARGGPVDLADIPDMAEQLRPALEAVQTQYPELARAPAVVQRGLLFPYLEGTGFVLKLWQDEPERVAPFGEYLPESTEQILDPDRFLSEPRDAPTEVSLDVVGATVLLDDVLGSAEASILLEALGAGQDGGASGWDGDRWALVRPDAGGPSRLVWASVWDSPSARESFAARLRPVLGGLPEPATLRRLDIDGRPVLILSVGGEVSVTVTLVGGVP